MMPLLLRRVLPLLFAAILAASPVASPTLAVPSAFAPATALPPDSTQQHYAQKDAAALRRLLAKADTREARLLCRYRLYPLTEDERYLEDLPAEPEAEASARSLALLSGLWGYRAARASIFGAMHAGRRSMRFLDAARERDPDDPFVLLVEGQSLLFRPAIAGGDEEAALERFRRLRDVLAEQEAHDDAVSGTEAALWTWYALRETGRSDDADALHRRLAERDLPPLYREFLRHPPG